MSGRIFPIMVGLSQALTWPAYAEPLRAVSGEPEPPVSPVSSVPPVSPVSSVPPVSPVQTVPIEEIAVTAPTLAGTSAVARHLAHFDLKNQEHKRLDQLFGQIPGLGFFRRSDSFTAHPTTQGLSIRGLGANAAGRLLVRLDGVPLSDPFGGWVYWSSLANAGLEEAVLLKGGGQGILGGGQALAGVLDLKSRKDEALPLLAGHVGFAGHNSFDAYSRIGFGSTDRSSPSGQSGLFIQGPQIAWGAAIEAGFFESDGPFLLAEKDRGPADERAASDHYFVNGRLWLQSPEGWRLELGARRFQETRAGGTKESRNEAARFDLHASLAYHLGQGEQIRAQIYRIESDFKNIFTSLDETRSLSRPVLDQFNVPAEAYGAAIFYEQTQGDFARAFGVDIVRRAGVTHENFRNLGAGFTRERAAGGRQWAAGFFGRQDARFERLALSAQARLDYLASEAGFRTEKDRSDDRLLTALRYKSARALVASGRLGADYRLTDALHLKSALARSWRLPSLNEYYRPFRVGNDITEANPDLQRERLTVLETGVFYQPLPSLSVSANYFHAVLRDGVGNITLGVGPGILPGVGAVAGFIPLGGSLRQRANIDQQITDGLELEAALSLQNGLRFKASYLYADARISRFDNQIELEGLRPAQTPKHTASFAAIYDSEPWFLSAVLRYSGAQFDDDQNLRRLDDAVSLDLSAGFAIGSHWHITGDIMNVTGSHLVTALSGDGLESLGQRRQFHIGLRWAY